MVRSIPISWSYSLLMSTDTVPPVTVQLSSCVPTGMGAMNPSAVQPPSSSSMMYCACCWRPRSPAVISAQGMAMPCTASPPPADLFCSLRSAGQYSRRLPPSAVCCSPQAHRLAASAAASSREMIRFFMPPPPFPPAAGTR